MEDCNKWKVGFITSVTIILFLYFYGLNRYFISQNSSASNTMFVSSVVLEQNKTDAKVIATAVLIAWEDRRDVNNLINKMLKSIEKHELMTILMFSDKPVPQNLKRIIANITRHSVKHIQINFTFPSGFNEKQPAPWSKRSKWGYMHMCRFWFRNIWLHTEIKTFRYILRLDTDSCLLKNELSLPLENGIIYMNHVFQWEVYFIDNLQNYVKAYVQNNSIEPKNPELFSIFINSKSQLPMWYNNIEITLVQFMNQPDVRAFTDYIDVTHGQYKYRWGDAPLRYITMALFAPPNSVKPLNLSDSYSHPCK